MQTLGSARLPDVLPDQTRNASGGHSLLDVRGAAAALGVSKSFLDSLRVTGGGPAFYKLGRKVAYDATDLQAWLNTRRRSSTSDAEAA